MRASVIHAPVTALEALRAALVLPYALVSPLFYAATLNQ